MELIRDKLGQAVVEFAIVLPILLLLAFGTVALGRLMLAQFAIENAAWEGARAGATMTDPLSGDAEILGAVESALVVIPPSCVQVEIHPSAGEWPRSGSWPLPRGHPLTVRVSCRYDAGFRMGPSVMLQADATSRMEYQNP
jgi:hypothetical protein